MKTVGVLGGAGFIGSYVTKKFLEEGYIVKISTRDISNKEKYKHLELLNHSSHLTVLPVDSRDINSVRSFLQNVDIVVHGGTPFQLDVNDPTKDLFEPTIKGTENFLTVVSESSTIEKIVIIASVAAFNTNFPMPAEGFSPDHVYTEEDKPYLNDEGHPYAQAKYFADQVVQNFIQKHPGTNTEIVNVYPVFVVGPALSNREDSTSVGMQYLFKNKIAPNPFVQMLFDNDLEFATVDVRDVADAIYQAGTKSGLHGNRYYLSNESWKISDLSKMLNDKEATHKPRFVYSGEHAMNDLSISFRSASVSCYDYASAQKN